MTRETDTQEILDYFRHKAADYDLVDEQLYWKLSDALLWSALQDTVLPKAPTGFRFLDAGGGTGRWTERILDAYPDCTGVLYDLSTDMVAEARGKLSAEIARGRLRTTIGDLAEVSRREGTDAFDLTICFHNVIGFVSDPLTVLIELAKTLVTGGRLVLFAPNKYHVAYFNLSRGDVEMANQAIATRGRFTTDMPEMTLFTLPILAELCAAAELDVEFATGFPVLLYPGYEETRIEGTSTTARNALRSADTFDEVFALERKAMVEPEVGARGNNLYLVAVKR